jgi:hypothetical protein
MNYRANAPPPLPAFGDLDVQPSPQGFVVRPRVRATSWLIEAAVWVIAGGVAAAMLALGSGTVRVVGAVVLVPIGIRALVRTIRFVTSKSLRQLSVALRAPIPHLAGPFAKTQLAHVVRFDVSTDRGDRYFCAVETGGRTVHLVTIEPADEPAYRALASWLAAQRSG